MSSITIGKFVYKKYIDKEKLVERLMASPIFPNLGQDGYFVREFLLDLIYKFPTEAVEDVRHGNAICGDHDEWWGAVYECSLCGERWMLESSAYKAHYCPWCGAKMDGERKEQE